MIKKTCFSLITMAAIFGIVCAAFAFEPGNERKGKYLFRSNCRTCHIDGGTAPALGPMDKTQSQWERVFDTYERLECVAEWEKLSDADRTDILTYLYGHAFDSPSPATCE